MDISIISKQSITSEAIAQRIQVLERRKKALSYLYKMTTYKLTSLLDRRRDGLIGYKSVEEEAKSN